jgi:hypothetical protein
VADFEEANRLAAEFEAMGGGGPYHDAHSRGRARRRLARTLPPRRLSLPPRRPPPRKLPLPWKLSAPRKLPPRRGPNRSRCAWRASGLGARAAESTWRQRGWQGLGRRGDPRTARI